MRYEPGNETNDDVVRFCWVEPVSKRNDERELMERKPPLVRPPIMRGPAVGRTLLVSLASLVLYAIVLRLLAESPLVKVYFRIGFGGEYGDVQSFIPVLVLVLVLWAITPQWMAKPSALVIWMLYLVVVVPSLVLIPTMPNLDQPVRVSALVSVTIGYVVLVLAARALDLGRVSWTGLEYGTFRLVLFGVGGCLFLLVAASFGVGSGITSWGEMYEARAEFAFSQTGSSAISLYSLSWLVKIISPLMIALGVTTRDWLLLAFGLGSQLLAYSISPNKLNLFIALVVIAVALAVKHSRGRSLSLAWAAFGMTLFASIIPLLFRTPGNEFFSSTVFRTLFIPTQTAFYYYEYFSTNPKGLFSEALPILPNPYQQPISEVIAQTYSSTTTGSFNAHLWADGSANLGLIGVGLVSLVLAILLLTLDKIAAGKSLLIPIIVLIGPALALTNGSLSTALLTAGLLLAFPVILLAPDGDPWMNKRGRGSTRTSAIRGPANSPLQ